MMKILDEWSGVLSSPAVQELSPDRVREVRDQRGFRYALKQVSTFHFADPVRRFTDEARILSFLAQRGLPIDIDSWIFGPDTFLDYWECFTAGLPPTVLHAMQEWVEPWRDAIMRALAEPHRQRVHGDAHGANILTDLHTVTGIIDADHLPLAPRIYDLAYYLAFWARWELLHDRPVEQSTTFVRTHLLAGYQTITPLTARELDSMSAMCLFVPLGVVAYSLKGNGIVGDESWIDTVRWIAEHAPR